MSATRPSATAQHVALARSHLTWTGVLADDLAHLLLRRPWSTIDRLLRIPPLSRLGHNPAFAYLAARTSFYDDEVRRAVDDGIRQIVVVGAGYDTRAWRFAAPGVAFVEVDQPATQADKRQRVPAGGPRFVAAEIGVDPLPDRLAEAGVTADEPTLFTVEGLTMYLDEATVTDLLRSLASVGGPGSRLAVNFGVGGGGDQRRSRRLRRATGALAAAGKERFAFELPPDRAVCFLAEVGWAVDEVASGADLAERYLAGTALPTDLSRSAFAVRAHR